MIFASLTVISSRGFELSLGGERIIVDAGCSQYIDGEIRQYCRGNRGHNSLTVDGRNQSEVWGAHRVARRAKPLFLRADESNAVLTFESGHDGYRLLPGRPTHMRRIAWAGNRIEVRDRVEGVGRHNLELRLHLHPRCTAAVSVDGRVKVRTEGVKLDISSLAGAVSLEQGWYCPKFVFPVAQKERESPDEVVESFAVDEAPQSDKTDRVRLCSTQPLAPAC